MIQESLDEQVLHHLAASGDGGVDDTEEPDDQALGQTSFNGEE